MKRHSLNRLTLVSLLLCVVTGGLWATSYRYGVACRMPFAPNTRMYFSGEIGFYWRIPDSHFDVLFNPSNRKPFHRHNFLIGFTSDLIAPIDAVRLGYPPETIIGRLWAIHEWFLTALFGVLPLIWMRDYRRERRIAKRIQAGLCVECGYDLRASADRCPECGSIPEKTTVKP